MNAIDTFVLDVLQRAADPMTAVDVNEHVDCCDRADVSRSLYRLRRWGLIEQIDQVSSPTNGKQIWRYLATKAKAAKADQQPACSSQSVNGRRCDVCGEELDDYDDLPSSGWNVCTGCAAEIAEGGELTKCEGDEAAADEPTADDAEADLSDEEWSRITWRLGDALAASGDPICKAIDRLPIGSIQRGRERAARLRHLAARLESVGPDVAADLYETASILERLSEPTR